MTALAATLVVLTASGLDGAVALIPGRTWLRILGKPFRVPSVLLAQARICEWQVEAQDIGLRLALVHPLFGTFAGYEVVLRPEEEAP